MLWNHLPLIEMDDYQRKGSEGNPRFQGRDGGGHLEMDIGRQLSQLREQSRTSREDYGSNVDSFGRDVGQKRPYLGNGDGGELVQGERDGESYRRMEGNSPHEWRRERDADQGYGDHERDRSRDRNRDWGRDEQRRRPRDYGDHGEYSDGSEGSLDGGRDGEKERYRDHRRDRNWDSDRFRGRRDRDHDSRDHDSRDRDDRDWRRDRWEDRDDNRKRDYRDRRRSDDNGQWSDNYRPRDRYHDDRDHHRREYHYEEQSEVVILKGLPSSVEDSQIHDLLGEASLAYKDIRVVKNREGLSRGFAFVEFLDVDAAKSWIDSCQGKLLLDNCSVIMDFSRSKTVMEAHRDWICSKCGTQNFSSKRRNACFCCNAPKDENDEQKDIGQTPCKVLILRGLDTLTTEETIRHSLSSFTTLPIFDVRLIKDKMTGTSRGFCFIELGSTEEATKLLEEMQKAYFKIDEKLVTVSYARFGTQPSKSGAAGASGANPSTVTSTTSSSTNEAAVTSSSSSANPGWPKNNFAANAIAQAHAAAKMGNTTDPIAPQMPASVPQYAAQAGVLTGVTVPVPGFPQDATVTPTAQPPATLPTVGAPAATVPAAVPAPDQVPTTAVPSIPPSAVSSYVYDAASGYYYDTTTGLYYDPSTQYYFNPTTQQYMYWDAATQQYVAVVSTSIPTPDISVGASLAATLAPTEGDDVALSKEKQKKAKSLNAKRIAKDMERWAKKLNVNKEVRPQTTQAAQEATKESTYQYDPTEPKKTGVKMSFVGSSNMSSLSLTSSSPLAALSEFDDASTQAAAPDVASSLVAEYGGEDSGGEDDSKQENVTDWTKMACLLCKRQFPTKDALTRHNQFSDLHKQNIQVQKKLKMSFTEIDDYEKQQRDAKYRDRAKERRELFGQPDSTPAAAPAAAGGGKKRKLKHGKVTYEQPTKDGITSDNIGNKMLQAMGWTQGTGLGKDRQGIVDPISAKMRNRSAGLGLKGSDFGAMAGDSERDILKKMAQSRYESPE